MQLALGLACDDCADDDDDGDCEWWQVEAVGEGERKREEGDRITLTISAISLFDLLLQRISWLSLLQLSV